jgi:predicted ATPase
MSTLKKFRVTGLWGNKDLTLDFHEDVNFLIGKNGSGKTTIINLIAAALAADFQVLDRVDFKKIEIHVAGIHTSVIEVLKKKTEKQSPFMGISYRFRPQKDAEWKEFSLDEIESQMLYREYGRVYRHARMPDPIEILGIHVDFTWLSIHRAGPARLREDKPTESAIDVKLDQLSNSLTRLFSQFKSKDDEQTATFQKSLFFALLPPDDWQLENSVKDLDLEREQQSLKEIFETFNVPRNTYLSRLEEQFKRVRSAVRETTSFTQAQITSLSAMWSIHSVVLEWGKLLTKQAEINKPRNDFLTVINEMLNRKKLFINESNELKAKMDSDKSLKLTELSSGEKQLLIILGEALLQQKAPWIYIADEPELSLHVTWQEKLTTNLRQINPSAQIIFATHSPDIVGKHENKVFDMEKLLR